MMMEEQVTEETREWVSGLLEDVTVWRRADGLAARVVVVVVFSDGGIMVLRHPDHLRHRLIGCCLGCFLLLLRKRY